MKIGRYYNADDEKYFEGYLDEIRITKGVARWTASFTTPYKAYQDSTPAILTGGYTITGTGTIENGLIDSTDQWEGSPYINTLGTILEAELTEKVTGSVAGITTFPTGHIIQVIDSKKTDTDSITSATWTDITGTDNNSSGSVWCCKITPRFASSKILIGGSITVGQSDGNNAGAIRFLRDSTLIGAGDAAGSRDRAFIHLYLQNSGHHMANVSPNFLDEPNTTSEVIYKAQFKSEGGSYTTYINRSHTDSDALANGTRCFSNILLMEIAG